MCAANPQDSCIFCAILRGEAPATMVYQDEHVAAFMDIRPVNPGHVLVIPRVHAPYLADLPPGIGGQLFETGMRVAAALRRSGVCAEGINLFLADGKAAMQEVFHAHLHVIPRYAEDGFGLVFAEHYYQETPRADLEAACQRIVAVWE